MVFDKGFIVKIIKFFSFLLASFTMVAHANSNLVYTSIVNVAKSPATLSVHYKVNSRPMGNKSNNGKTIGVLSISGLPSDITGTKLRLSDSGGVSGRLTFTDVNDPSKKFQAKMIYAPSRALYPKLNSESTNMMGKLPETVRFNVVISDSKPIPPGKYNVNLNVNVKS